jgi:hypothetical protein
LHKKFFDENKQDFQQEVLDAFADHISAEEWYTWLQSDMEQAPQEQQIQQEPQWEINSQWEPLL